MYQASFNRLTAYPLAPFVPLADPLVPLAPPRHLAVIALILFSTISLPTFIVPSDHMAGLIKDGHVAATLAHFLLGAISLMTMFTAASLILITNLIVSYPAHRIRPRLARARKLFGVPVQLLLLVTIYLFPAGA